MSKGRRRPIDNHCNSRPKRLATVCTLFLFSLSGLLYAYCNNNMAYIILNPWDVIRSRSHCTVCTSKNSKTLYLHWTNRVRYRTTDELIHTLRTVCASENRRKTFNRKKPPCAPHYHSHTQWYIISGDGGLYNPKTFVAATTVIL